MNNEYQNLYNQYKYKTDEQLIQIINDNSYEPYARQIAQQVLCGDRSEFVEHQNNIEREYQHRQQMSNLKHQHQSYTVPLTEKDAIFRIAKDVRIIRNIMLITICSSVGLALISLLYYIISEL